MAYVTRLIRYPNGPKLFFEKLSRKYWDQWKAYKERAGEWPVGGLLNEAPFAPDDAEAYVCQEGDVSVNVEYWGVSRDGSEETIVRLAAEAGLFNKGHVNAVLDDLAAYINRLQGQGVSPTALEPSSFTWIGDWDWTTENSDPGNWGVAKVRQVLATAPRGLCAADGSLIAEATKTIDFGFLDSARQVAYLCYSYLGIDRSAPTLAIVDGCGDVPLASIAGVRIIKQSTVAAASVSTDGTTLAILENGGAKQYGPDDFGADGFITLYNVATGQSRRLAGVDHASGSQISFSPDDKWLFIPCSNVNHGPVVVNAETGASRHFPDLGHASCWWVRDGNLGLLCLGDELWEDSDPYAVTFFNLTTGTTESVTHINDDRPGLDGSYRRYYNAEPNADGRVLISRWLPTQREGYRADGRYIAVLDLNTGTVASLVEPYADPDHYVERKQKNWRWNSPLQLVVTQEPAILRDGFNPPEAVDWPPESEYDWGAFLRVEFDSPLLTGQI